MLRTIDSRIKIESNINIKITIHMIEKLHGEINVDEYGNIYGTYHPSTSQIVDKINELIDKINELDVKVNKLSDILKYSDNTNTENY